MQWQATSRADSGRADGLRYVGLIIKQIKIIKRHPKAKVFSGSVDFDGMLKSARKVRAILIAARYLKGWKAIARAFVVTAKVVKEIYSLFVCYLRLEDAVEFRESYKASAYGRECFAV